MYSAGAGVEQDDVEAFKWYKQAAAQDYAKAQYALGHLFVKGKGVPQDEHEASEWFLRAAKRGYYRAQHMIGVRYAKGQGVQRNYICAYAWLKLASEQCSGQEIRKALTRVGEKLSSSQIAEAEVMASISSQGYVNTSRELVS